MKLNVYDVSAIVYTATCGDPSKQYYGYPTAGIHAMMRYLIHALETKTAVLLCFDSPTDKCKLVPTYKKGRVFNPEVSSQIDSLYEDLQLANYRCLKEDNLEADDLIHAAVMANYKKFDEVNIFGNDYDLCHSITNNVIFRGISSLVHTVNYPSFCSGVEKGKYIRFNTLSAHKSLCGCSSDKVPGLVLRNGLSGDKLYQAFLDWFDQTSYPQTYEITSAQWLVFKFALDSGLFTKEDQRALYNNAQVVYPRGVPAGVDLTPSTSVSINRNWFSDTLSKYGLFTLGKSLGISMNPTGDGHKNSLYEKVNRLKSGVFTADKGMPADVYTRVAENSYELEIFDDDF